MTKQEAHAAIRCAAYEVKIDFGRCTVAFNDHDAVVDVHVADATADECDLFRSEAAKLFPMSVLVKVSAHPC